MMEGPGPMGPQGQEMFGPNNANNGPMGPDTAFNQGGFNFNEFLSQNNNMMGELAYMANPEAFNQQGPNGPQGFEGPGAFNGPQAGPGGLEVFGPGGFEGPMPGGFDLAAGFQGPVEGFQAPEFQAYEFQPPPELLPPPPGDQTPPPGDPNPPPPPPEPHHHDLSEAPHVPGDGHDCIAPQCS